MMHDKGQIYVSYYELKNAINGYETVVSFKMRVQRKLFHFNVYNVTIKSI